MKKFFKPKILVLIFLIIIIVSIILIYGFHLKKESQREEIEDKVFGPKFIQLNLPADIDSDGDGLKDVEEKKYGTETGNVDTDMDGITDYEEVMTYKTNPKKVDTDNDGVSDGDEIRFHLNPTQSDSRGDGIKDGNRKITNDLENKELGVKIKINGIASRVNADINEYSNKIMSKDNAFLSKVVDIKSDNKFDLAYAEFNFDKSKVDRSQNIGLYTLNKYDEWEEVKDVKVDYENSKLKAILKHFSVYGVADKRKININNNEINLSFVIDNSNSMKDNDPNNIRIQAIKKIMQIIKEKSEVNNKLKITYSLVKFSEDAKIVTSQTNNANEVTKSVDALSKLENGTTVGKGLFRSIEQLEGKKGRKLIILLSDGQDSCGFLDFSVYKETILSNALDKAVVNNIQIISVALGKDVSVNTLRNIANKTGGLFFASPNDSGLIQLFENIGREISKTAEEIDTDKNGAKDAKVSVIADSGFNASEDGLKYANFSSMMSPGGQCFGISTVTANYYNKTLENIGTEYSIEKGENSEKFKNVTYNLTDNSIINKGISIHNIDSKMLGALKQIQDARTLFRGSKGSKGFKIYKDLKDNRYELTDEARKILTNAGITIIEKPYEEDDKIIIEDYYIDNRSDGFKKLDTNEKSLLDSIIYWQNIQTYGGLLTFVQGENKFFLERPMDIDVLENELSLGRAQQVAVRGELGGHAMVAQRLLQDENNPNKMYIELYDNNFPDTQSYIEVAKVKKILNNSYNYKYKFLDYDGGLGDSYELLFTKSGKK